VHLLVVLRKLNRPICMTYHKLKLDSKGLGSWPDAYKFC
jgi:hypothetical protein